MSPENWRRVEKVYAEAWGKLPGEREQYLNAACGEDLPEIRAKVEELLRLPPEDDGALSRTLLDWVERALQGEPTTSENGPVDVKGKQSPPVAPGQQVKVVRVVGPGGMPGGDLQTLLHRRLQFAALLFAGFLAILLFKAHAFYDGYTQFGQYTFLTWTAFLFDHVAFAGEVIVAWLLWSNRPLSLPRLRQIELIVFGLPVLDQSVLEWQRLFVDHRLLAIRTGTEAIVSGRYVVLPWFALIVGYGVFIPNAWRRCSAVVSAIAGLALAVNLIAAVADGVVFRPAVLLRLFEVVVWLAFAVAFAVYNSYRIEEITKDWFGQYRLLRLLGRGGMGEVYRAEHRLLKRPCAIKLIRPERAHDPHVLRRFESEAQAVAALTHPNTIVIHDYGQAEDGRFYYAMEYLEGMTLAELVLKHGTLPPGRVVFLLRQVCSALREAHERGLIHRDIKPGNVMVCERGGLADMAKLLDFGLVQTQGPAAGGQNLTGEGMIVGTVAYMSPEQAEGRVALPSDLYSLGATAYFLLTGRPPFTGKTILEVIIKHARDAVVPPSQVNPGVPDDLQAVVLRCLDKDPGQRYQSADALEKALEGCRCAAQWDQASAAAWWRNHGAAYQTEPEDT
jgi:serine/threonine-protein kinase